MRHAVSQQSLESFTATVNAWSYLEVRDRFDFVESGSLQKTCGASIVAVNARMDRFQAKRTRVLQDAGDCVLSEAQAPESTDAHDANVSRMSWLHFAQITQPHKSPVRTKANSPIASLPGRHIAQQLLNHSCGDRRIRIVWPVPKGHGFRIAAYLKQVVRILRRKRIQDQTFRCKGSHIGVGIGHARAALCRRNAVVRTPMPRCRSWFAA
jgi:hypothetical protein